MPKTINLGIDYPKRFIAAAANGDGPITSEQVTLNVLVSAVNLVYNPNNGKSMGVKDCRIWSRIQDKIQDEDGAAFIGDIELSDEQFDWINEKVNEAKYPPVFAGPVTVICAYLDEVKSRKKSEPVLQAS